MRNAGLEEAQAGIKIARRNINNHRYADDTTLMAESEEEPKSLLMKVKEEKLLVAQTVKGLPTIRETWLRSLDQEDPLEKEMATHSSILASKIWRMEEPGGL